MSNEKQVFHLTLEGPDSDFGLISNIPVKITFEEKGAIWDTEQINDMKELLADFYGVSGLCIRTDEEEKKDAADLEKYLKEQSYDQPHLNLPNQ